MYLIGVLTNSAAVTVGMAREKVHIYNTIFYLCCLEFTSPCYGNSGQWHLEVRAHCGISIWWEENIVWQLWTSPLVMLRAVVRIFDPTASSHRPWVRGRHGRFLFGVPLSLAPHCTPWFSRIVGGRRGSPNRACGLQAPRLGLLSWDLRLSHAG